MLVRLTENGKTLIETAVVPHVENEKRLLAKLDPDTRQQLENGLKAWLVALEESNAKAA